MRIRTTLILLATFVGLLGVYAVLEWTEQPTAEELRRRQFQVLPTRTTVRDATRALLSTGQGDFPVVAGHQLAGMISREELLRAVAAGADDCPVAKIMRCDVPTLDEDATLAPQFMRMLTGDTTGVPVVMFGQVIGILTEDSIQHWLRVRSARQAGQAARAASSHRCRRQRYR